MAPGGLGPIPGARRRAAFQRNNNNINNRNRPPLPTTAPRASGGASLPGSLDPAAPDHWREAVPETPYCVLNFYHLVDLPDPDAELEAHRLFLLGEEAIAYAASGSAANASAAPKARRDVRGRIYLSRQGVNCQAGGPTADCLEYARWAASRAAFVGLRYTLWPCARGHAHPRLRLKRRASLVSLAGGMEALLSVTDPSRRAAPLAPDAWARMLATAQDVSFEGVCLFSRLACLFSQTRKKRDGPEHDKRSPGRRRRRPPSPVFPLPFLERLFAERGGGPGLGGRPWRPRSFVLTMSARSNTRWFC